MRYSSYKKLDKCPKCGSSKVVKIVYGEPSYEDSLEAEAGKIILGGCVITGNDPHWGCIDCKVKIFKRKFRAFP
ncbi:MAG: hypothetical protein MUO72_11075 [Bacteroidales bacterium]|nr:hypothetical protein [Bacteroidales bacterium]